MASIDAKPWAEIYEGGDPDAERRGFRALAQVMLGIQEKNREAAGRSHAMRTLHSKILAGLSNAELRVDASLPTPFHAGHVEPGASLRATVRFSNASGVPRPDSAADMRGIAVRLMLPDGKPHDLLMTNYPVSHARNARQFVEFAVIATGDAATLKDRLVAHFGEAEALRMIGTVMQGMRMSAGLHAETFWSRGAILWGTQPVRLLLRPPQGAEAAWQPPATPDGLREGLARYLRAQPLHYRLAIQPFVDEQRTPIEDAAVEWRESVSAPIEVASLVIPAQDILSDAGMRDMAMVDSLAFNPWNAPAAFRPLGNINRARGEVYGASAKAWASPAVD